MTVLATLATRVSPTAIHTASGRAIRISPSTSTGEDDSLHPQWVIVDLTRKELVDSIRIAWAAPYATHYLIQYWTGDDPVGLPTHGAWETLPNGIIDNGKGGSPTIHLSDEPISIRFMRVLMTQSSNTCDADGSSDIRNCGRLRHQRTLRRVPPLLTALFMMSCATRPTRSRARLSARPLTHGMNRLT